MLTTQLRTLGLYAANTLGDGNCLFRALSDQYYGSPSRHVEVRRDVCNWIQQHQERYEGFVDEDEFGSGGGQDKLHEYLSRMRENGEQLNVSRNLACMLRHRWVATYGGHMELSAFAHMTRRNIKVIQPGLVYIIQCDSTPGPSQNTPDERQQDLSDVEDEDDYVDEPTIYVACVNCSSLLYVCILTWIAVIMIGNTFLRFVISRDLTLAYLAYASPQVFLPKQHLLGNLLPLLLRSS